MKYPDCFNGAFPLMLDIENTSATSQIARLFDLEKNKNNEDVVVTGPHEYVTHNDMTKNFVFAPVEIGFILLQALSNHRPPSEISIYKKQESDSVAPRKTEYFVNSLNLDDLFSVDIEYTQDKDTFLELQVSPMQKIRIFLFPKLPEGFRAEPKKEVKTDISFSFCVENTTDQILKNVEVLDALRRAFGDTKKEDGLRFYGGFAHVSYIDILRAIGTGTVFQIAALSVYCALGVSSILPISIRTYSIGGHSAGFISFLHKNQPGDQLVSKRPFRIDKQTSLLISAIPPKTKMQFSFYKEIPESPHA